MRAFGLGLVIAVGVFGTTAAHAYDTFIPTGLGYSTSNVELGKLTPAQRAAIAKADAYEAEINARQLQAQQSQARMQRYQNDRNFDPTDSTPRY